MSGLDIDVVIVGKNASETLRQCLESAMASEYRRGRVRLYYVDRASRDDSVEIARAFKDCTLVELLCDPMHLSCARNAGWQASGGALVQFLDAHTILDPDWFQRATKEMGPDIAAVEGESKLLHVEPGYFNWVAQVDQVRGANFLIRRKVLEELGGYNEAIATAEEFDLAHRMEAGGHRLLHLSAPMLQKSAERETFETSWKRAFRMGKGLPPDRLREVVWRGGLSCALIILAVLGTPHTLWWLALIFGAVVLLLYPRIFQVEKIAQQKGLSHSDAAHYAWYSSLAALPQFLGAIWHRLKRFFGRR